MRQLVTLALAGLFGGLLLSGEASACHKKKKCPTPCETVVAAPAPVCAPAPAPVCAPAPVVCEAPKAKKCHFKMPKMGGHKKKAATCEVAPMMAYEHASYPSYAAPQSYASPQASHQGY